MTACVFGHTPMGYDISIISITISITISIIYVNVGGELLLGGAYSDSVFKANSDFSDL